MEVRPGYKQTEVGVIPEEWGVSTVGDIGDVGRGRVISHREISKAGSPTYPVYSSQTSNDGVMGHLDSFDFEGDHITWTTDGANAGTVFFREGRFNCTNVCGTIKLKSDEPRFVARVLARAVPRHVSRHLGNPKLMNDVMKRVIVPLPPLPEQRAIAAAFGDADALLEGLTRLIAKKRDLKQAAMQQILTGQTRLPGFHGEWEVKTLHEVCQKIQDGTHFSPTLGGNDYLYVTSKNIRVGTLDLSTAMRISTLEHEKIYARCDVRKGDLLLTKDGVNTGNAALNSLDEPFSLLSSVAMLRFDDRRFAATYFMYQLLSAQGQEQVQQMMSGNAITRLTLVKIRQLRFPVPSLAEQSAIATVLSDMDAELSALEARRDKTQAIKQAMMQELLTGRTRLV